MSLIVELNPRLILNFNNDNKMETKVDLRTKNLYKLLLFYKEKFSIFTAVGGNFGEEILKFLKYEGVILDTVKIRDDSPVGARIEGYDNIKANSESQVYTFDDIHSIKNRFVSSIYQENNIVIPVYEPEKEFTRDFIMKAKEYYKNTIIFGPHAAEYLKYKPAMAIFTRDEISSLCPFKLVSDYEFVQFSYSLVDDKDTRILIMDNDRLYFYKTDVCFDIVVKNPSFVKTLFGVLFALENDMDKDDIIQFVASCNMMPPKSKIGDIVEKSSKINVGVYRR